jgi:hypothetical protein
MLPKSQAYDNILLRCSVYDFGQAIVHHKDSAGGCLVGCGAFHRLLAVGPALADGHGDCVPRREGIRAT